MTSSARRQLIAGNWKLNKTLAEAGTFIAALRARLGDGPYACDVAVAPVATALTHVHAHLSGSAIWLGGQDTFWESSGAFTGAISAPLLRDVGCSFCIVGHSERRQLFGERDADVGRKCAAVLAAGLAPIVCVGETLEERDRNETLPVVLRQLAAAIHGLDAASLARVILAYEPVWAIGTGRNATPDQAQQVHAALRAEFARLGAAELGARVRILYGGSVKPDNAAALLAQPDVDGALVGGAALNADAFAAIVGASRRA